MRSPFLLIGHPGNKRTAGLQQARQKLGLPPVQLVSYLDLLRGEVTLEQLAATVCGAAPYIRLDAPGQHFLVERELIALGAVDAPEDDAFLPWPAWTGRGSMLSMEESLRLEDRPGTIHEPAQWYRGYCRFLARISREAAHIWPKVRWMNAPRQIAAMFDKRYCQQLLSAHGVDIPDILADPDQIYDYDSLRLAMAQKRRYRVFVKLAYGSGASGVVAYAINPKTGDELAQTTIGIEMQQGKASYFNAGKLRRYTEAGLIRPMLDWLLGQGAQVEQWIEKETHLGQAFDIRQLVVDGQACHCIARLSRTPITNLHLRNARLAVEELGLGEEVLLQARQIAERALLAFPGCTVAGLDVLIRQKSRRAYVIDVNPFGDLLYGVLYNGYTPYEWEMKCLIEKG